MAFFLQRVDSPNLGDSYECVIGYHRQYKCQLEFPKKLTRSERACYNARRHRRKELFE